MDTKLAFFVLIAIAVAQAARIPTASGACNNPNDLAVFANTSSTFHSTIESCAKV